MSKLPKELDELCIKVGTFIEYWGFKEIEGRIWCHLLLSDRALCPQDLIERTGVSKGLISISLARLLEYDVIRLEYTEGRRTQYFQVNENVMEVIRGVLISRERELLKSILESVQALKKLPQNKVEGLNTNRINFLLGFVKAANQYLKILIFGGDKISKLLFEKAPSVKH